MNIGAYQTLELIGKGGMATVYRAFHSETGQVVALKVMSAALAGNANLLKRFEQECTTAMRLQHPNIVQGYGFGVDRGRPFLVMEFVEGESLADRVALSGKVSETEAIRIGTQIGLALELAHSRSLIHRDVHPGNVLLAPGGVAKLADLGLVKDLEGEELLTRSGAWVGTLAYMAPEQFGDAKNVDARCDVYGLAATLYFALTGRNPFPQKGGLEVLGKKLKSNFAPIRQRVPMLSERVEAALSSALDADVARRPHSCRAFVEMLTA